MTNKTKWIKLKNNKKQVIINKQQRSSISMKIKETYKIFVSVKKDPTKISVQAKTSISALKCSNEKFGSSKNVHFSIKMFKRKVWFKQKRPFQH